jgi:hypothetical protein
MMRKKAVAEIEENSLPNQKMKNSRQVHTPQVCVGRAGLVVKTGFDRNFGAAGRVVKTRNEGVRLIFLRPSNDGERYRFVSKGTGHLF